MPSFVSIIIPYWNEEKFIREYLESILNQDYPKEIAKAVEYLIRTTRRSKENGKEWQEGSFRKIQLGK